MRMLHIAAAGAVAVAALSVAAGAHEFTHGAITVDHPMAYETSPTAQAGGGFMTIMNAGDEDDRLVAVRADFPKVQLHTTIEEDGVARMMHLEAIEVPAGEIVALRPGGYHVMFMGLGGDAFEVGEEIPATLVFEKAGEVEIVFNVEARGTADNAGKSGHGGEHKGH